MDKTKQELKTPIPVKIGRGGGKSTLIGNQIKKIIELNKTIVFIKGEHNGKSEKVR